MRANYAAAGMLGGLTVYLMFSTSGTSLFAPAPVASRTVVAPSYVAQQSPMMWQPNAAQPVAYAPAYNQGYATVQTDSEFSSEAWIVACFAFGAAAGYGAHAVLAVGGEDPDDKAKTIGAAGLGAVAGLVLFGSLPATLFFGVAGAYAAQKNDTVKSAGSAAANVYNKAVDLEQEYEVIPKAKSAIDTVVTVADNLNKNYGLTDKIDEKLQLSERVDSLSEKFTAQKDKLSASVDELKNKASS